jgi:hypothetical protein
VLDVAQLRVNVQAQGAEQAARQLETVAQAGGKAGTSFDALEAGTRKLGSALVSLFAAERLIAFFGGAAAAAGRFEASLVATSGAMGFTATQMRQLEASARALAVGTVFSADQVGDAFDRIAQDAGQLATTPQQLEAITGAAIELAQATRSALPEAANALLTVLRQFGGGDAQQFANVIADLGSSAEELQGTAAALNGAGDAAAALGLSLPETAAAIKVLGAAGIEASEAGAALRGVLLALESEASANLKPSVVGLEEALRNAAGANVEFGDRAFAAAAILTGASGQVGAYARELERTDAASRQAKANLATFEAQVAALRAGLATLQQGIGTGMLPAMTDLVGAGNSLIATWSRLNALDDPFGPEKQANVSAFGAYVRQAGFGLEQLTITMAQLGVVAEGVWDKLGAIMSTNAAEGPAGLMKRLDEIGAATDRQLEQLGKERYQALDRFLYGPATPTGSTQTGTTARPALPSAETEVVVEKPARGRGPSLDYNDAAAFMGTAQLAITEDPIAQLQQQFDRELAAYAEQGSRLVQQELITETDRAAAILALRQANEQELTSAIMDQQSLRAGVLLDYAIDTAGTEAEADALRLDAQLQARYDRLVQAGVEEAQAHQMIAQLRDQANGTTEAKAKAHADRLVAIDRQKWFGQLSSAVTGTGALIGLLSGSSDKAFKIQQAAAVASALVNVYASASQAYINALKEGGNPMKAAAMAGLASSAQLAQVSSLRGVSVGSGGGGGGGGGGSFTMPPSGAATANERPYGDAPGTELLRQLPRSPIDRGPQAPIVEVHNYAGAEVSTETREGPNGEAIIAVVVQAVAQDLASSGPTWQALSRKAGLNQRLGVRS